VDDMPEGGVVCMASQSAAGRLALLANMLVFTGLALSWESPDIRPPGKGEGEGGTGLYCPFCPLELSRRPDEGNVLFCDTDGLISEDQALSSPLTPRS